MSILKFDYLIHVTKIVVRTQKNFLQKQQLT